MFLKSLTIKGFKSFADATTLSLEPGVTVVVGPNGSGKSNVVDAIAWVLGAQAPTAVRSQKMDDVIFAGTSKRAALGRAEVTLTIDNSSGLLPIEFNEVTITRTLFRSGDSEYCINSVPCRLLDIQELLSDSGVGRQQHVVVSQGQIDAVLNARPEERRQIIEEAAGVLKFRKRKEKAERRLESTEANLHRVSDLLREVRRQLRPLEKQADAARRHGDLVAELRALQVYRAGRELTSLRDQMRQSAEKRAELTKGDQQAKAELSRLDAEVMAAEAQLAASGGDDMGDALVRYEALRERARGVAAVLTERQRGIERDRGSFTSRDVVANLESEAARVRSELAAVESATDDLRPELERLRTAEAELAGDRQVFAEHWADGVAAPSGEASEIRGELGALRSAVSRNVAEHERLDARRSSLEPFVADFARQRTEHQQVLDELATTEGALLARIEELDAELDRARGDLEAADGAHRRCESEHRSWVARIDALTLALDEARSRAGAERLADIEGVLGTLLDVVDVDPGYEAAFAAAAGEALSAIVVDSVETAKDALRSLRSADVSGAVLALGAAGKPIEPPPVGIEIRAKVRSTHQRVDDLLDILIGHAVVIDGDAVEAVEIVGRYPGAVVVTAKGDRVGPTGWRVGTAQSEATGAALDDAHEQEATAARLLEQSTLRHDEIRAVVLEFEEARRQAGRDIDESDTRRSAATEAAARVDAERSGVDAELASLADRMHELGAVTDRESTRITELQELLPDLEAAEAHTIADARAMSAARSDIEERAEAVGALRTDLEVRAGGLEQRHQVLTSRLGAIDDQLERDASEREAAQVRRIELDNLEAATTRLCGAVETRLAVIETELTELREMRRRQSEKTREIAAGLDSLRQARTTAERSLEGLRERASRAEIDEAEVRLRLESAVETVRRDLDTEPERAMEATCPELPDGMTAAARLRDLERELKLMGPINPLALEEFEALQERHAFLNAQLDDIRSSRQELRKVIRAVDEEIINVFASAFADVAANFEQLFAMLFPGGTGKLELTDAANLLQTGIEVVAKPGGKNVRKLSLLSGGERSLTALAFLFAVFRSRPSPFYVMDEVEAALDDLNLHRFLTLIHEFRQDAQLLIVSHQKRTMEAADCLYGVSMQPGGASKVVSEKVSAEV